MLLPASRNIRGSGGRSPSPLQLSTKARKFMTLPKDIQKQIIDKLKPIDPEKVILFGSYAYGTPGQDSDIDILVVTNDEYIPKNFQEKIKVSLKVYRQMRSIRKKIPMDLIVHTIPMHKKFIDLNGSFAQEILKHGNILYERNH